MSIEEQIAALESMSTDELTARYEELYGKRPRTRRPQWLRKRIAYRVQEIAYGGLSMTAKRRLEELIAELDLPFGDEKEPQASARNGALMPGMSISREWHGENITVQVLDDGFEWNGERFQSLSAVARAVTGSKWSGPLFFGLSKTKVAP